MGEGQLELADVDHRRPRLLGPLRPQPRGLLPAVVQGGPAPFAKRDRSQFLQALDKAVQQALRK